MKIFLSHASECKARVRAIAAQFPGHVQVWLDANELATGARLPEHIGRAIDSECDYVLVFVDRHALASEWVRRETALALEREIDLNRPFMLPVLLEPLAEQLHLLGDIGERVWFDATDASDEGVRRAGEQLCGELFKLASQLIETLRSSGRREVLGEFAAGLAEYKQAAFMWLATLANPLSVLSTNQGAFDNVCKAVEDYNHVADRFIPRLDHHRRQISQGWSAYRGLTQDFRALSEFIENDVYRGALFELNEVHAMVHQAGSDTGVTPQALAALEQRREALIERARDVLDAATRRSTQLIAELEREI